MNWLQSLSPDDREQVFALMRNISDSADDWYADHRRLTPNNGDIAVGSAHIYPLIKSESLREFLRSLRTGSDPWVAKEAAKTMARLIVKNWNAKREWQVYIWEGTGDDYIGFMTVDIIAIATRIREESEAVAVRARPTPESYLEYRPEGCGHDAETMPF